MHKIKKLIFLQILMLIHLHWFFNGSPDASLQTQEISVIQSGLYGVSISDEYGCSIYADTLVQMIGVEEFFIESFEVYPNPTDGLVSIHYDLPSKSPSLYVL